MRVRTWIAVGTAVALMAVGGGSLALAAGGRPVPADKPGALMVVDAGINLPGDTDDLLKAMKEYAPVKYKVLVVDDVIEGEDRTAYIDRVAEQWAQPEHDTLLLVIFTRANNDIRFFMGADFRQAGVTVEDMLSYVRNEYLANKKDGNVAGALASLVRKVNRRMEAEASRAAAPGAAESGKAAQNVQNRVPLLAAQQQAMTRLLSLLEHNDVKGLAQLVSSNGLVVMPYRRVGAPDEGLKGEAMHQVLQALFADATVHVAGYKLSDKIDVVLDGVSLTTVRTVLGTPVTAHGLVKLSLRPGPNGKGELWLLAVDDEGELAKELQDGVYKRPFDWLTIASDGQPSSAHFERDPMSNPVGKTVTSVAEARQYLSSGVAIPSALEGQEMFVWQSATEKGSLQVKGLSSSMFWARFRPAGDHRVVAHYGTDFTIEREERIIGGRPALVLHYALPKGPQPSEIWLEEDLWVYELRGDFSTLVKLAQSMPIL